MNYAVKIILSKQQPLSITPIINYAQGASSAAGEVVEVLDDGSVMVSDASGGEPQQYWLQNRWVSKGEAVTAIGGRAL